MCALAVDILASPVSPLRSTNQVALVCTRLSREAANGAPGYPNAHKAELLATDPQQEEDNDEPQR